VGGNVPLCYVTYGCIVMTHGSCQQCRKSHAPQSRARFAAAVRLPARCGRANGPRLLGFTTSGIPIPSTSATTETRRSGDRFQDCFHGQTFREVGGTSPFLCRYEGLVVERHRQSSAGGFADPREKAWVIDHEVVTTRYSWNIDLIVCYRQNWNRFMTY